MYIQVRVKSIIGPRAKQYNGIDTYTTTQRNKTVIVENKNISLLYSYFQQNQCLNIKKKCRAQDT